MNIRCAGFIDDTAHHAGFFATKEADLQFQVGADLAGALAFGTGDQQNVCAHGFGNFDVQFGRVWLAPVWYQTLDNHHIAAFCDLGVKADGILQSAIQHAIADRLLNIRQSHRFRGIEVQNTADELSGALVSR